jgi:hypothetical protein
MEDINGKIFILNIILGIIILIFSYQLYVIYSKNVYVSNFIQTESEFINKKINNNINDYQKQNSIMMTNLKEEKTALSNNLLYEEQLLNKTNNLITIKDNIVKTENNINIVVDENYNPIKGYITQEENKYANLNNDINITNNNIIQIESEITTNKLKKKNINEKINKINAETVSMDKEYQTKINDIIKKASDLNDSCTA